MGEIDDKATELESFTEEQQSGAPPIDLIDSDRLCDLLKEYGIGVTTRQRHIEDVEVVLGAFEDV